MPGMTPSEVRGMFEGLAARHRQADEEAWGLGKYVAYGVNAPKKYPREPFSRRKKLTLDAPEMTDKQMQAWAQAFAERMSGNATSS